MSGETKSLFAAALERELEHLRWEHKHELARALEREFERALAELGLNYKRDDPVEEHERRKVRRKLYQIFALITESERLDAFIGARRRRQFREFGLTYGKEKSKAAALEHAEWIKKAISVWSIYSRLSITDVAAKVREKLNLHPKQQRNIRRIIAKHKPKKN